MEERTVPNIKIPLSKTTQRALIPCLIVLEGGPVGDIYRISKSSVLIGRGSSSDICLTVEGVSRQHARIDVQGHIYTITDLESTNGTLVNGQAVQQGSLKNGDEIYIGEVLLRFSLQDAHELEQKEKVRTNAVKDHLTGVANKDYYIDTLRRELNYAFRQRNSLTCVFFQIDELETIRHQFGAATCDQVVKTIATQLQEGLRAYDLVARFSESRFAIILRDTALENAMIFAQRSLERVAQLTFDLEGRVFHVNSSVGVATANPDYIMEVDSLLRETEHYVELAKAAGKNKIRSQRN